jgi:hypothetical protein
MAKVRGALKALSPAKGSQVNVAKKYVSAGGEGDNPYKLMVRYLRQAQRIIRKRHMGKFRRANRYLTKGGIRK